MNEHFVNKPFFDIIGKKGGFVHGRIIRMDGIYRRYSAT